MMPYVRNSYFWQANQNQTNSSKNYYKGQTYNNQNKYFVSGVAFLFFFLRELSEISVSGLKNPNQGKKRLRSDSFVLVPTFLIEAHVFLAKNMIDFFVWLNLSQA